MERELAERTRQALLQPDLDDAMALVARVAVETGLCDFAGITEVMPDKTFRTTGATDSLVNELDGLQYELNEGPCVLAAYADGVLHACEVLRDPRWPVWGPEADRLGIGAVISVHLHSSDDSLSALNLYSRNTRDFADDDFVVASLIGAHASIALAHFRDTEHLWKTIDTRHRIGQAQGILMERFNLTAEASFSLMRRLSQEGHIKLHTIADQVVRTRTLPTTPHRLKPRPGVDPT